MREESNSLEKKKRLHLMLFRYWDRYWRIDIGMFLISSDII